MCVDQKNANQYRWPSGCATSKPLLLMPFSIGGEEAFQKPRSISISTQLPAVVESQTFELWLDSKVEQQTYFDVSRSKIIQQLGLVGSV
jgi:hypothetical protein